MTALLLVIVGGAFTGVLGVAGEPSAAPLFGALHDVLQHAVAIGIVQLAISVVGIVVGVRAARGARGGVVASAAMHAVYACALGVVAVTSRSIGAGVLAAISATLAAVMARRRRDGRAAAS